MVKGCKWKLAWRGASRDYNSICCDLLCDLVAGAVVVVIIGRQDVDLAGGVTNPPSHNAGVPLNVGNAVLLHEEAHTAIELLAYAATFGNDGRPVLSGLVKVDAPLLAMRDGLIPEFGVVEQRFTWDTSPVEAYAAKLVSFNNGSFHAKLSTADSADVSAGATADNDEIEVIVRCHKMAPNTRDEVGIPGGLNAQIAVSIVLTESVTGLGVSR